MWFMRFEVKQIEKENEESVLVCCYDTQESWVQDVKKAAYGQIFVRGYKNGVIYFSSEIFLAFD